MRVVKFGGTSVATAESIRQVVEVVRLSRAETNVAVVVSALGGVTNELLACADLAAERGDYDSRWHQLRQRHWRSAGDLELDRDVIEDLDIQLGDLRDLLRGVFLLREASARALDGIVSYGERLSSRLVAATLSAAGIAAEAVDSRGLVITDDAFGRATVDLDQTYDNLRQRLLGSLEQVPVITGFIGSTAEGHTTTLGRGGSDYTAALVGAALEAESIELWTDVDGVMSADPRLVPEAFAQHEMSYAELMELSHFGAKVVYPPSIHPARSRGIPLAIRNTFNPAAPGTRVEDQAVPTSAPIRGITSIRRVALMRLEGDGMVGVPGIAQRLFGALARRQVSVILISQSSSEHSICFAVAPEATSDAKRAVDEEFYLERQHGVVDDLVIDDDLSVLAAVGEQMADHPGIAGRLFSVLGEHGVNVRAIAQGSSELNISLVVDGEHEKRAVKAVHDAFFSARRRRVDIALAGVGTVGRVLLDQIAGSIDRLRHDHDIELRVIALASSRRLLTDDAYTGIDLGSWRDALDDAPQADSAALIELLSRADGRRKIFVDCTASDDTASWYEHLLRQGVAVVAANKKPFAAALDHYLDLTGTAAEQGTALAFETTVAAGLPVLSTLRDLRNSGDDIQRIDGVLSGTLNAVLDRLSDQVGFSQAVRSAYDDGLTEPHPYDDLSGTDVQRKLLILARLAGRQLEAEDVVVEPLLDSSWSEVDLATFWPRLSELDETFEMRHQQATEAGQKLRYLATLDDDGARVELKAVGPEHPAFGLTGPDNLVAFTTARYTPRPLVIRGPGAGPEVTAGGVFADILKVMR